MLILPREIGKSRNYTFSSVIRRLKKLNKLAKNPLMNISIKAQKDK